MTTEQYFVLIISVLIIAFTLLTIALAVRMVRDYLSKPDALALDCKTCMYQDVTVCYTCDNRLGGLGDGTSAKSR